ncbi:DUF5686 and carboxypeptidase-like regulatory domain-containing protein [Spirosoma oryzicola]|uniref:DUF5686 and carboxypeptidase-like regulatory domain-containing protein n=1 Tax=Spirosoma oryzicola TaxID=2898794 RepID=UPI001E4FC2FC|nr:DUF5686 and carboxypeptidase-like regulatory domain-containing protein [Spirosoma oryzicola]UHG94122.1 DUF5686 and carboxypeptidase regulatory-like domain-containing protein [Spirosoma oryzicola]
MNQFLRHAFSQSVLLLSGLLLLSHITLAQTTTVTGTVTDGANKEPLPFANIVFEGTTIGTTTNERGGFTLTGQGNFARIAVSFIGYKTAIKPITPGIAQTITIRLEANSQLLNEVVIRSGKRARYRNKNNPAVELIRNVISHKEQNQLGHYDYADYEEYDKLQFSLSSLSTKIADRKIFQKYRFLLENRDTTTLPGKSLLPIYLEEKLSQHYNRRSPHKEKTIIKGDKRVDFGQYFDNNGLSVYLNRMYSKIDIYENSIFLMTNQFLSPIAGSAPTFYQYYLADTITVNNTKLVGLNFVPRNTTDMLFEGKMYVTLDSNYAVQKINLSVNPKINLNWVRDLQIRQQFEQHADGKYYLSKSDLLADFGINKNKGGGVFGQRTLSYRNYHVNEPQADEVYDGQPQVVEADAASRPEQFWLGNRHDTLSSAESKVYKNIDSLKQMPSFKRTMEAFTILFAGYKSFGSFEVGPANTFYSFNPVEGFRLRLGGRTTPELSKRYYAETYAAYGFKDERWKYFLSGTYSINNKSIYQFPQNYIRASFQRDTKIPGQELQFVQEDNFLLSFKRGVNDKWLYNDTWRIDYVHEFENHFSYSFGIKNWQQEPAGGLEFKRMNESETIPSHTLTTTEFSVEARWAPNEQFYQGKIYRTPIANRYPIFSLRFATGVKGLLNSEYSYQNLTGTISKRFFLSQLGYSNVTLQGGYIFGQAPFPLLNIHRANQTYAYQLNSYNLMNFLEFVSDHYASVNLDHSFNGFFFNKIPLFKKLKWREAVSFKALYGGLRSQNDPKLNPSLYQFPVDASGVPYTYTLNKTPYLEASVGVANVLKFFRIDLVKRLTYLDHPNVSPLGIRARATFDF